MGGDVGGVYFVKAWYVLMRGKGKRLRGREQVSLFWFLVKRILAGVEGWRCRRGRGCVCYKGTWGSWHDTMICCLGGVRRRSKKLAIP